MAFRHSKIVCTIGPASRSPRTIERLLHAGMDVARLNFSHGSHANHAESIAMLRAAALQIPKPTSILADLHGPQIRTRPPARRAPVLLPAAQPFVIPTPRLPADSTPLSTASKPLPR